LEIYLSDALEVGDRTHELLAHRWLAVPAVEMGDIARGRREIEAAIRLADELGNGVQQWMTRQIAAAIEMQAGDLDRAEALANEALVFGTTSEPTTSFDYFSIIMWTLAWARGTLAEFAPYVEAVANAPGADAARRAALAVTYCETGRVEEAREVLAALSDEELDSTQQDGSWFMLTTALGEAAYMCGDERCGRWVLRATAPYTDRLAITSVCASGPVAHAAGLGALAAGEREIGVALLRHSLEVSSRTGGVLVDERTRAALSAAGADAPT
jgi:plasmid maintenance system antidote protein VapI